MPVELRFLEIEAGLGVAAQATEDHKGRDHVEKAGNHAHAAKPAYCGVVTFVKDVNYELVAKADSIALYVSDHGKPVDLKGASAKVPLLSSVGKTDVALTPAGLPDEANGRGERSARCRTLSKGNTLGRRAHARLVQCSIP